MRGYLADFSPVSHLDIILANTVVPHLMTLIRSSEIAVERKRRKAKFKNPLKRTENRSMRSNGLKTHRPVKILHTAAIFCACIVRNPSLSTCLLYTSPSPRD